MPGKQVKENYREPHGVKYRCIFNIVNEDDFVPEVPMKDYNWTKYGRTATISFNSNKSSIESAVRNSNKTIATNYITSATKKFICESYKGDTKTIEDIVRSFNTIFEDDPENMRYSAYSFYDKDYVIFYKSKQLIEAPMPKNTKPYQKIDTSGDDILMYQMPAYFMQYLAHAMHGGFQVLNWDDTDISFAGAAFAKRYFNQSKIIKDKSSFIKFPHYLEPYYIITQKVSIIDFQ